MKLTQSLFRGRMVQGWSLECCNGEKLDPSYFPNLLSDSYPNLPCSSVLCACSQQSRVRPQLPTQIVIGEGDDVKGGTFRSDTQTHTHQLFFL